MGSSYARRRARGPSPRPAAVATLVPERPDLAQRFQKEGSIMTNPPPPPGQPDAAPPAPGQPQQPWQPPRPAEPRRRLSPGLAILLFVGIPLLIIALLVVGAI